jgi:serine/threonine-protein kinase
MASVWSATNIFTERQVAIKFMLPAVARTQEAARRFLLEAKVSARIDHPNVIEVMDVGQTEDGTLFLVMELLTGVSLETALKRQNPTMTLYEFTFVMIEVGRALAAAHKRGIIHRDLKPTNIFLHKSRDGVAVPKLLDFGVSKFLDEEGNHGLTVAGTVLGSPLYMSPEQARGEGDIDGRTDIFAFGGIMFEALCGSRAYDGANFNQLIVAIATKPPKNIDEAAPHMPESLRAITAACLTPDREKRVQNFDEVAERLLAALPQLEHSGLRLPAPAGASTDPDATNALPVVRPSDRPPPLSLSTSGGTQMPWATPSGVATRTVNTKRGAPVGLVVAIAAIVFGALIVGAGVIGYLTYKKFRASRTPPPAPTHEALGTKPPDPPPPPSAASDGGPPVFNVDSLPVAPKGSPSGASKGTGHLSIGAAPGTCTIYIDGVSKGPTPIATIDVPAGLRQIKCELPNGKSKATTVIVTDGATAKYKFNTDE